MKFKSKEEAHKHHLDNYKTDHLYKISNLPHTRGYNRVSFILGSVPKNSLVLDVGCNGGGNSLLLQSENDCYVKGIDLLPELAEKARKRGVFAEQGEAEDLSRFDDKYFDSVLCSEVLEHLFDPGPAIKEAFRILKPGGLYVVTFPHPNGINGGVGDHHQTTYNEKDIDKMFADFIDVQVYGIPVGKTFGTQYNIDTTKPQWFGITAKKPFSEADLKDKYEES